MNRFLTGCLLAVLGVQAPSVADLPFRVVDIQRDWGVVYAVRVADVNADGRPDIIAINPSQLAWFENPSWQRHVIVDGVLPRDHVTIAAHDIDGDGRVEIALGAGWNPRNTSSGGELFLATRRDAAGLEPWAVAPIGAEPTLHRIRWAMLGGQARLIVTPLHGRGTAPPNWDGIGARVFALTPPGAGSTTWATEVVDDSRHILHNFVVTDFDGNSGDELVTASREGLTLLTRGPDGAWSRRLLAEGAPGEVVLGRIAGRRVFGTIEPWHGTSVVTYVEGKQAWARTVVDSAVTGGHAVAWADFDGDGDDELVAGWRDGEYGLARYRINGEGGVRDRQIIDRGVAVEDLVVADMNADGRPDIVAGGRSTGNVRLLLNEGGKR